MKALKKQQRWLAVAALTALALWLWLWLRDAQPSSSDIKTMQKYTENMRTVCAGRFLIDVPKGAKVSGRYGMRIASIEVYKRSESGADELLRSLDADLAQQEQVLRAKPLAQDGLSRFIATHTVGGFGRILHHLNDKSYASGEAEGYVVRDKAIFLFKTSAYEPEHIKELADFLREVEPTLRARADDEIPTTSGFCIDGGLVGLNPKRGENIPGWSWTLPDHPDVRFGLTSSTNDDKIDPGIVDREASILQAAGATLMKSIRTLRKQRFEINGMQAQEWSIVTTDDKPQFNLDIEIPGKPNANAAPAITLSMRVGGYGKDGYQKPSLTEGEALALWDAVVHSLRPRPGAV